jgi:hypothetical protein
MPAGGDCSSVARSPCATFMNDVRQSGSALIIGLTLLALVSALGLASASAANLQWQLARQEYFRQNAASAASAGLESAINSIVSSVSPDSVPASRGAALSPDARYESLSRFVGFETGLPQPRGANLAGAHFEIVSTGHGPRGAIDRQRISVMWVIEAPMPARPLDCEPIAPGVPCRFAGELRRLAWQRLPR